LLDLYDQISAGQAPAFWSAGMAFEHLVLQAFSLEGVEVQWPFEVTMLTSDRTMEQIDGALYLDGLAVLVEAKDTQEPQNIEAIAKLKSQLDRRPPQTLGLAVSRSGFTLPAAVLTRLIAGGRIMVWTGEELRYGLANGQMIPGLRSKYRRFVEQAVPDALIIPTVSLAMLEASS